MTPPRMRKLLSIDGGGVRGLAAIVVLEQLMDVANEERRKKNLEPQEPWQMFDMIAGTSTGGLIAVMLGRLRMPLRDCKEAYIKLSESVFTPRNLIQRALGWGKLGPKFETGPLENAIQDILNDHLKAGGKEALLLENDDAQCKVFVVTHLENITEPEILRSYRNFRKPKQQLDTMKIWQACRATSAAITFFEPIVVSDSRYSDGGLFYNNPVTQINAEGMEIFPGDDILILSLGTGIGSSKEFSPNVTTIPSILADIATQTTWVAHDFYRTARKHRYYRFDVPEIGDIGLEEYKELGRIKKLTEKYLNIPEVGEKGRICAERLAEVTNTNEDLVTEIRSTLRSFAHNPRRDKIDRSYQKTFEWVWTNDKTGFVEWLKSGREVYWISGRLGAGKSTLMRYVLDDARLKKHFPPQQDSQTIICKYFFSELSGLATKQEKSLSGFLHSFLNQLLENVPELIPWVWPTYIEKVRKKDSSDNSFSTWSEVNLKEAIGHIMEEADLAYNVILFIDGLDECEGNHRGNLEQLQSWIKPDRKFRSKICIASRDLPEFECRLKHYPGLKIHEWTAPDIRIYVEDELHNAFSLVSDRYAPDQGAIKGELVEAVVKNARGVFLWVKLAVSDLVIGIEDSRYYRELKQQLDKIPSELEDVYGHLIEKIRPEYLYDAFEYFQILLKAPGNTYTFTLLQVSLATRDPREAIECCCQYDALDARNSPSRRVTCNSISCQHYDKINLKQMETRIRGHCRGLIQVQARKMAKTRWDKSRKDNVVFIHRTVVKYIQKPEVTERIKKRLSREGELFLRDTYVLIMASYLRLLKMHPCYLPPWDLQDTTLENFKARQVEGHEDLIVPDESSGNPVTWDDDGDEFDEKDYQEEKASNNASNAITCFLNYAERAEISTKSAQTAFIDELNRVMSLTDKNWASIFFEKRIGHWFYQGDILCLAICWKLKLYVREKFNRNDIHSNRTRPHFWYAMNPPGWTPDSVDSDTLRLIIGNEAQRDETYEYHNHRRIGALEHVVRQVLGLDTNRLGKGWHKVLKIMLFEKVQLYRLNEVFRSLTGRERTIQHLLVQYIGKHGNDQDAEIKKCLEWLFIFGADVRIRNSEGFNVLEVAEKRGPKAKSIVEEAVRLAKRKPPKRARSPTSPVVEDSANQRSLRPRTGPP